VTEHRDRAATSEKTTTLARQWTRRAALGIVSETGGRTVKRSVFRRSAEHDMTIIDAEPMAGLRAATSLMHAALQLTTDYIRQAREDGHSWHEIGIALNLGDHADPSESVACAAYDYAGDSRGNGWRSFAWSCPACHQTVIDNGPEVGHPADAEAGHADDCPRLASAIAAWGALWEAEAE
jgi:hypothetical protein